MATTIVDSRSAAPEKGPSRQSQQFIAASRWSADRPEALVICCSDGRWHGQIEEFVRAQVSERADLMALPGGPAMLSQWTSSFEEAKTAERALKFLCEHHKLSSAWLIAHQDCAYYASRYGPLDPAYQLRRQFEDLERAGDLIRRLKADLAVHLVFASREADKVVFTVG